jgi:chromosome segregation ATPase
VIEMILRELTDLQDAVENIERIIEKKDQRISELEEENCQLARAKDEAEQNAEGWESDYNDIKKELDELKTKCELKNKLGKN